MSAAVGRDEGVKHDIDRVGHGAVVVAQGKQQFRRFFFGDDATVLAA